MHRSRDEGSSSTSIGAAATAQQAAGKFTTTHWSMVLEAQSESPVAQEALEKLCRIYWQPIYSFVQRQGIAPQEAVDFRQRYQLLLREEIAHTVATPGDIEDELRHLIAVVRA